MRKIFLLLFTLLYYNFSSAQNSAADSVFKIAETAFNSHNYQASQNQLNKYISLYGSDQRSLYLLVHCYGNLFNPDKLYIDNNQYSLLSSLQKFVKAYLQETKRDAPNDKQYSSVIMFNERLKKYPQDENSWSLIMQQKIALQKRLLASFGENMVTIKGGTFMMGNNKSEANEKFRHKVTLDEYQISKYEVTQEQWEAIMGFNPSHFKESMLCPVENIDFFSIQVFIKELNRLTGKSYRLPTEAEWEYAARSAGKENNHTYSGSNQIDDVAWYNANSNGKTNPVGQKKPNKLGLYDMSGNVSEWCQDKYTSYYADESLENPGLWPTDYSNRVIRGGNWYGDNRTCNITKRSDRNPIDKNNCFGFRLVLSENRVPPSLYE